MVASFVVTHGLQSLPSTDFVAPRHMGSCRSRDGTYVPCIGR